MCWVLDFLNFYYFWSKEDFLIIIILYAFIKYIIVCSFVELIWPTQFFNRRNIITNSVRKYRTFTEIVLKLLNNNYHTDLFFKKFIKSLKIK